MTLRGEGAYPRGAGFLAYYDGRFARAAGASGGFSHHRHGAFGEGVEEGFAVVFGEDAGVQDDYDAAVLLGAEEAAYALAEF
jgi:hypothetical protein